MSRRTNVEVEGLDHGAMPIPLAAKIGNLLISGGIAGRDPATHTLPDTLEGQCAHMFANLRRILEAAGGSVDDVVRMTVYVPDRSAREVINREWVAMFPNPTSRPARHTVMADLAQPMLVQCEIYAVLDERPDDNHQREEERAAPLTAGGGQGDVIARLSRLDTCAVSDALDRLGLDGVVLGLGPVGAQRRVAGRAVTVQLGQVAAEPEAQSSEGGTPSHRHLGSAAVDASGPGDVIVVAHGGRSHVAGWGGLLSLGAVTRGVEGVLVDGACRDVDEARELGLPVYARGAVPVTARGRVTELSWNTPIMFGEVAVTPGDLVIADGSGIAFVPAARAAEVIAAAEEITGREQAMAAAVRAGRPVSEVMGAQYESLLKR